MTIWQGYKVMRYFFLELKLHYGLLQGKGDVGSQQIQTRNISSCQHTKYRPPMPQRAQALWKKFPFQFGGIGGHCTHIALVRELKSRQCPVILPD